MNPNTDRDSFQKPMTAGGIVPKNSGSGNIKVLGLCLGASTVSLVQLDQDQIPGKGNPTKVRKSPRVVKYSPRFLARGTPQRLKNPLGL